MKKSMVKDGIVYKDGSRHMKKALTVANCFGGLLQLALNHQDRPCSIDGPVSIKLLYTAEHFLFVQIKKENEDQLNLYFDMNDDPGM